MRPGLIACLVATVALGLVGCGGGAATTSHAAPSRRSETTNGEAGKPAAQILADTAAALYRVHSFHIQGGGKDITGAPMELDGDFALPGRMRLEYSDGDQDVAFVLTGGAAYIMANRAFWIARSGSARTAALVMDRWIKVPPATAGLAEFSAWGNPATIGHCLVESHLGTVGAAGTEMYDGRPVIVLRDHGNLPESAPGELYVAATGHALAVRVTQTGPNRPGGVPDHACGETSVPTPTTRTSDLTISRYNQPVQITAPANAISIPGLQGA